MKGFRFGVFLEVPTDAPDFVDGNYYVEMVVGKETERGLVFRGFKERSGGYSPELYG